MESEAAGCSQPMIRVERLLKKYRATVAVNDLSFDVHPHQILGLIGRNGAGKTTTLRALSGIIPPTSGLLEINGFDVIRQPIEARGSFAMIPDDPALFDLLTVWEHLEFIAATYRVPEFEARADQLLELFELSDKRDAAAQELSRGMRQKVSVCCALLHDPQALFFDEPLTGLDPRAIRTLKDCIQEQAARGKAVIISSHLLSLVEDMCTHLLILEHGVARFCGPLNNLRNAFPEAGPDATLEQVFFFATEHGPTQNEPTEHAPAARSALNAEVPDDAPAEPQDATVPQPGTERWDG